MEARLSECRHEEYKSMRRKILIILITTLTIGAIAQGVMYDVGLALICIVTMKSFWGENGYSNKIQ